MTESHEILNKNRELRDLIQNALDNDSWNQDYINNLYEALKLLIDIERLLK